MTQTQVKFWRGFARWLELVEVELLIVSFALSF